MASPFGTVGKQPIGLRQAPFRLPSDLLEEGQGSFISRCDAHLVEITATETETGVVSTALTNESATYQFPSRQPGPYRVTASLVNSILDEMSTRGDVALGLATGNTETGARIKLERAGLNRYFAFGGFGSDPEDRTELVWKAAGPMRQNDPIMRHFCHWKYTPGY